MRAGGFERRCTPRWPTRTAGCRPPARRTRATSPCARPPRAFSAAVIPLATTINLSAVAVLMRRHADGAPAAGGRGPGKPGSGHADALLPPGQRRQASASHGPDRRTIDTARGPVNAATGPVRLHYAVSWPEFGTTRGFARRGPGREAFGYGRAQGRESA